MFTCIFVSTCELCVAGILISLVAHQNLILVEYKTLSRKFRIGTRYF